MARVPTIESRIQFCPSSFLFILPNRRLYIVPNRRLYIVKNMCI